MNLLDFPISEIDRLFAFRSPCVSREQIEGSLNAETTTVYGVKRIYEFLTGYPYLARGAWVASKAHAGYWVPSESYGDEPVTPNYDRLINLGQIFTLLDLLRPVATVPPVDLSGMTYPRPLGAYGLAYPQCEIAVQAGERLAWLIVGQEIAGRVHAFVFDRFNVDGDESRPRGLYRIRRSYARLLVQAAGPLRNAPSECRSESGVEGLSDEAADQIRATTSGVESEETWPVADPERG